MMRSLALVVASLALVAPIAASAEQPALGGTQAAHSSLGQVLADPRRDADRARDAARHPVETLRFFRVQPGMTVVDYMPSGGWWTRILVPYLGPDGRYIGLNPDVRGGAERQQQMFGNYAERFPAQASGWTGIPVERLAGYNTDGLPPALNGTVDRVMIMREVHNMQRLGWLYREMTAIRALLKPDGLLGIEEHRAKANALADYADGTKGYMRERDVIALIEAHGFELVARSNVNANRRDPADHADGVWVLPPNLRGVAEADKPRFQAIGESDRMTLLFRKRR